MRALPRSEGLGRNISTPFYRPEPQRKQASSNPAALRSDAVAVAPTRLIAPNGRFALRPPGQSLRLPRSTLNGHFVGRDGYPEQPCGFSRGAGCPTHRPPLICTIPAIPLTAPSRL